MPSNPNTLKAWLPPILLLFGGFFLLLAVQEGCYQKALKLTGVVIAKEYIPGTSRIGSGGTSSPSRHRIQYRFTTPEGESKKAWSDVLTQNWDDIHEGDPVDIEYLSATGDSRIPGQTASAPVFFSMGVVMLLIGFVLRRSARSLIISALIFFSLSMNSATAQETAPPSNTAESACGDDAQQGCPCGKLPVCIISDHPNGFYSAMPGFDSGVHSEWKGFGQGESDFAEAMAMETKMAAALVNNMPCIEPILLNSYMVLFELVRIKMEDTGLDQQIKDAKAAGDQQKLEELYRQVDALYQQYGLEDFPWRNENLMVMQNAFKSVACITRVTLSGESGPNGFTMNAQISSPMAQLSGQTFSTTSSSPDGGVSDLAKQAAKELKQAQQQLFCCCQEVQETCQTTKFDLGNPESQCTIIKSCCGKKTTEGPTPVAGLRAGTTEKAEPICCSEIARVRAGETLEGEDSKDAENERDLFKEIWCPGTWNLHYLDQDCDGVANAKDDTPWPAGEEPPGEKP